LKNKKYIYDIKGISFRYKGRIIHTEPRPLIENLDELPFPAYHLVEKNMGKYNFSMMAGNARYMIIESSRGCEHNCAFCTQWVHWGKTWRTKSPKRIVDEIEYFNQNFGGTFFWFTDDNFKIRVYGKEIYEEMKRRRIGKDVMWFVQTRADEIVKNRDVVPRLRDVGNYWMLVGIEHNSNEILKNLRKNMNISESFEAIRILNKNDIFSQATFIIGSRKETAKSLEKLREFSIALNPGLAIYMVLTPFPGTILHRIARRNKWIEDENYANYDMVHAIMGTETLTRDEVQNELYQCYRDFYGSSARKFSGIFSRNPLKRRVYRHFALRSVLRKLKEV
jgi:anaerobic magnesium-protoporphyrin IX monomethyl ester cyclase